MPVFSIRPEALSGETLSAQKIRALLLTIAGQAGGPHGQRIVSFIGVRTG